MKRGYAAQYGTPCIIVSKPDLPSADDLIEFCRENSAIFYEDGPDDECFVVDIGRGVGPEIWTARALQGSLK